ncbi:hypothetical protein FY137_09655 [Agrobacterium tumefaciens]|nr:hypothetical protein FY137_09655 [Agrobacterium tumefaciens]
MDYNTFKLLELPYVLEHTNNKPTAVEINETISAYQLLAERMTRTLGQNAPTNLHTTTISRIFGSIKDHLNNCLLPGDTLKPSIPTPTPFAVKEFSSRLESITAAAKPNEKINLGIQAFAAYLYEVRALWTVGPVPDTPQYPPNVVAELNNYATWKTAESSKNSDEDILGLKHLENMRLEFLKTELNTLLEGQRQSVGNLSAVIDETKARVDDTLNRLEIDSEATKAKIISMDQTVEGSREKVETILKQIDTAGANVASFATAVREELRTDSTKKLWKSRARGSAFSFWVSAAVIAAAIIAPPFFAFMHIEAVIGVLRRIGDAAVQGLPNDATTAQLTAATISRLVVVSAPLALYFWAIKLLVRFNARSMMLMDDARQRHTTMDTYFHLIEKNATSKEERGLMLSALFRPLPGQGTEIVEPPNFADLLSKKSE